MTRIIAGQWRGRALTTPAGTKTRPTSVRLRQAIFDMLAHAPWAGKRLLPGAIVLDLFAGTGAMGLEALSRGGATAEFYESDPAARHALLANINACAAASLARLFPDALRPAPGPPATLVFLDPPYGSGLTPPSLTALGAAGRLSATTLIVAEGARADPSPVATPLAERTHGAARVLFFHPL